MEEATWKMGRRLEDNIKMGLNNLGIDWIKLIQSGFQC
jgi:hypothetical protein